MLFSTIRTETMTGWELGAWINVNYVNDIHQRNVDLIYVHRDKNYNVICRLDAITEDYHVGTQDLTSVTQYSMYQQRSLPWIYSQKRQKWIFGKIYETSTHSPLTVSQSVHGCSQVSQNKYPVLKFYNYVRRSRTSVFKDIFYMSIQCILWYNTTYFLIVSLQFMQHAGLVSVLINMSFN